jgi:uncharacterized protein YbjT (DUF2867 family)
MARTNIPLQNIPKHMKGSIVVAGGTGNLGGRIINALLQQGANVRVIARSSSDPVKLRTLETRGVAVFKVDTAVQSEVARALEGATCVVSALAGLNEVVIDTQKILLDASVSAGVQRFIPSDYSLDFTHLLEGRNRNLDMRRDFHALVDRSGIAATTIFNGAFMELLTGDMPMIMDKRKRIMHWGDADQRMDLTTMNDTAAFTARAALDPSAPRYLKVAGDRITARELAATMSEITSTPFRLWRVGGVGLLNVFITLARTLAPGKKELYPAWQGMQYMRDMVEGRAHIGHYDNDRYPGLRWTTVKDMLTAHYAASGKAAT